MPKNRVRRFPCKLNAWINVLTALPVTLFAQFSLIAQTTPVSAQPPQPARVLLMYDMEGITGINDWRMFDDDPDFLSPELYAKGIEFLMAMLDPGFNSSTPAAAGGVASTTPAPRPAPAVKPASAPDVSTAEPIRPGVYECINQAGVATPLAFGIQDASSYMASNGKRGQYEYDVASATLMLDPGPTPARYRRVSATTFRLVQEDGQLGGFTCPLNQSKNADRPPW
jgi:hypothetical protein